MNHEPQATKPKHRLFRFRLRTLFVFVTVLGVLMGWVGRERIQSHYERQVAKQLEKLGATFTLGGPYDSVELWNNRQPQGWWRRFAKQVLGERILWTSIWPSEVKDLTPLAGLTNLQVLEIHGTRVGGLTPLAGVESLQELSIESKHVSDLTPLARLRNLRKLHISVAADSDLAPLSGLKNLQELVFHFTLVSDLTALAGLKNLQRLNIRVTPGSDLTPLSGLKNMQDLSLHSEQISDLTPLAGLTNLQTLYIYSWHNSGLRSLAELKNLQVLHLGSSPDIDEQVDALQQALPNCRISRGSLAPSTGREMQRNPR